MPVDAAASSVGSAPSVIAGREWLLAAGVEGCWGLFGFDSCAGCRLFAGLFSVCHAVLCGPKTLSMALARVAPGLPSHCFAIWTDIKVLIQVAAQIVGPAIRLVIPGIARRTVSRRRNLAQILEELHSGRIC